MTITVDRIDAEDIEAVWPILEPIIARACATDTVLTTEDIKALALSGHRQIWAVIETDDPIKPLAVLSSYERDLSTGERVVLIEACAGRALDRWAGFFLSEFEALAKAAGCSRVVILEGRLGWLRKLRPFGYEPVRITLQKKVI